MWLIGARNLRTVTIKHFAALVDTSGIRASLSVALRKGETLLGMINVYRQDVRPFTDNQIKLVKDFASSGRNRHRERAAA